MAAPTDLEEMLTLYERRPTTTRRGTTRGRTHGGVDGGAPLLAEEAPFAAARAAVEDAQLRSDELRFSELQPRSYHEAAQLQAVRQKIRG